MYGEAQVHPAVARFLLLLEQKSHHLCSAPMPAIAVELGVSVSHLQHLVRRDTGVSCRKLIRQKCVERMKTHLREHPEETISEIAYQHGHEPQAMIRYFDLVLGSTPSEIRKSRK